MSVCIAWTGCVEYASCLIRRVALLVRARTALRQLMRIHERQAREARANVACIYPVGNEKESQ